MYLMYIYILNNNRIMTITAADPISLYVMLRLLGIPHYIIIESYGSARKLISSASEAISRLGISMCSYNIT